MTVVNPKSISGINSITMASGSDDLLTIHSNNTTERVRVNNSGDVIVGSGVTLSPDGDAFFTGVCTATTFKGDGSQLSNVTSTTINNNANNRVITGSGSANTLEGESELTYDSGTLNLVPSSGEARILVIGGEGEDARITLSADDGDEHIDQYNIESRASDNSFRIDQFSGGSRVDRLSIDSDASGGNVTVHTGNLVIGTSGKGINFSATSDGAGTDSSELLDDYEEGTWTPSIKQGGGSITNTHVALYTKVGRLVHIQTYLEFSSSGATGDAFQIQGLPYIVATNNYSAQVVDFGAGGKKGAYSRTDPGAYYLNFLYSSESTGSGRISVKGNQIGSGYIIFSNTYMTS